MDYQADITQLVLYADRAHLVMLNGHPVMSEKAGKQKGLHRYLEGLGTWMGESSAIGNLRSSALSVIINHSEGRRQRKARELLAALTNTVHRPTSSKQRLIPGSEQPAVLMLLNEDGDSAYALPLPSQTPKAVPALFSSLSLYARLVEAMGRELLPMQLLTQTESEQSFWTWCFECISQSEGRSEFLYALRKELYRDAVHYSGNVQSPFARIQRFCEANIQRGMNAQSTWLGSDVRYQILRAAISSEQLRVAYVHAGNPAVFWKGQTRALFSLPKLLHEDNSGAADETSLDHYVQRYEVTSYGPQHQRERALACRYFPNKASFGRSPAPQLVPASALAKQNPTELQLFNQLVGQHSLDFAAWQRPERLFGGLDLCDKVLLTKSCKLAQSPAQYPAATRGKFLIVGAGNSGLLCALMLRSIGYDVEVIEKAVAATSKRQALFLTDDTLMFLDHLGVLHEVQLTVYGESGGTVLIEDLERVLANRLAQLDCAVRRGLELIHVGDSELRLQSHRAQSSFAIKTADYQGIIAADGAEHRLFKLMGGKVERSARQAFAMLALSDRPHRNPLRLDVEADPRDFEVRHFSHPEQSYLAVELSQREYEAWSAFKQQSEKGLLDIAQELLLSRDHLARIAPESMRLLRIQPSRLPEGQIVGQLADTPVFHLGDNAVQGHFMLGSTYNTHVRSILYLREHCLQEIDRPSYMKLATENHQRLWELAQRCFFKG